MREVREGILGESVDTASDGVGDNRDAFPTDPNEWADSDGDGSGDNAYSATQQIDEIVVTPSSKSGGGGAIDLLVLMLLGWMVLHRLASRRQAGRRRINAAHQVATRNRK